MMTFEQFQATKTPCADLGAALTDESLEGAKGFLYCTHLYIETVDHPKGKYDLVIGNQEWISDDLTKLEADLYDFAKSEGYCD